MTARPLPPRRPRGPRLSGAVASLPRPAVGVSVLLMVGSTVVWRRGDLFDGGVDVVVVGKALLSLLALALAWTTSVRTPRLRRVGTASLWFLLVLLVASVFGALSLGDPVASAVVAVRVAIVAVTVHLLLRVAALAEFLSALAWACGLLALTATGTGLPSLAEGRLFGGIPPLNPNEIAFLAGIVVLVVAHRAVLGHGTAAQAVVVLAALGVLWVTGSRTAFGVLVVALGLMALHVRRPQVGLVVGGALLASVGALALGATSALVGFLTRDGAGASTLESRFIAWRAATGWAESAWQWAFGGGLAVKVIPVEGQWWNEQLLDSSWVSAFVQSGLVGAVTAAAWVLWVGRGVRRLPFELRSVVLALVVFDIARSLLESGLFDATPAFILFLAVSLAVERGSTPPLEPPPGAGRPTTAERQQVA